MKEKIKHINECYPGFNIFVNDKNKIVVEEIHIGGPSLMGIFDSVDELMDTFESKIASE